MKYFRQDKYTGQVEEMTRSEVVGILKGSYKNPKVAIDLSSKDNPVNTNFAYYWAEPEVK